ncbi:MAG: DUF2196 domain-containing protein [Proteobacteria bacterium]|nr:DUF2196 domain-containing protein [Pseudomonadota bacterium]
MYTMQSTGSRIIFRRFSCGYRIVMISDSPLNSESSHHPHGIKVRLEGGIVGRVKEILGT